MSQCHNIKSSLLFCLYRIFQFEDVNLQSLFVLTQSTKNDGTSFVEKRVYIRNVSNHAQRSANVTVYHLLEAIPTPCPQSTIDSPLGSPRMSLSIQSALRRF